MEHTNETKASQGGLLPFDPIVVIRDVAKHWLTIVMLVVAVGVGSYILTDMQYEPQYQSQATFVVTARSSSSTVYSNLSSTTEMATVFSELINSSVMRKNILEEMGTDSFDGTISANAVPETNLLNMTVNASDPWTAFRVAQAIIDHHEEVTYQVVDGVSLEILQGAEVPTAPVNRPNASGQMKKMGLLAGLAACAVFAWRSFARDTVRSGTEVRKKLDCDYLGEVPHEEKYKTIFARIRRRKSGILVTNPVTGIHFVENMRKLARRVEQHMGDNKVLMVTSVLENEGKSTVAVNLALSLAQKGKKVLLIDCDLRKPACHVLLEQKLSGAGIRDVLAGRAELKDALIRYKRTNMYMLLEKRSDVNSGDLLSSSTMRSLLKWARREFDIVVLDLPPMSVVSDSETVANIADAGILVVRQNMTRVPDLNKAIAALEGGRVKMLGCVLNNVYSTFLSSGQGYRYGGYGRYSHYGTYGSYGEKSSRK